MTKILEDKKSGTRNAGWGSGLIGVIIFSGTLPATRLAVVDLPPLFAASARAVVAAILAMMLLAAYRESRPQQADLVPLLVVATGVVAGFPFLTSLALTYISAAHAIVFVGLLPLATAVFGVVRGGERPRPLFWLFSVCGAFTVAGFAWRGDDSGSLAGNSLMLGAILLCGLGYAEGAALSRRIGGWQVISWALLLALPVMAVCALSTAPADLAAVGWRAWAGLAYLSLFSMLIGFIFWYRGLALGGVAGVGQLQLLQPFFGFLLAALVLGEAVTGGMIASALLVIFCVAGARRFA